MTTEAQEKRARILACARETGWGGPLIARHLGYAKSTVCGIMTRLRETGELPMRDAGDNRPMGGAQPTASAPTTAATGEKFEVTDSPSGKTILCQGETIRSIDGALAAADVDLAAWEIESSSVRKWDVTLGGDPPRQVENWYVSVKLKPRRPPPVEIAINAIADRIKPREPIPCPELGPPAVGHTLELCLYDHHFGMLSWHPETGGDYDLRVAERLFIQGVSEGLRKAEPYPCERIIFPVGNDMFHVDDDTNQTPANKNTLDVDCRLAKVFEAGVDAVSQAVAMCLERTAATVDILWIPGNHDPHTGFFLGKVLEAIYRNDPRVSVDVSPDPRKYRRIGRVLLGYTHGHDEKQGDLPLIMATECHDFGKCDIREWHIGHLHKRRETKYTAGDTFQGVGVRVLPSLAWADRWHHGKGYVAQMRSSDLFVWHPEHGMAGMFTVYADQSEYAQVKA